MKIVRLVDSNTREALGERTFDHGAIFSQIHALLDEQPQDRECTALMNKEAFSSFSAGCDDRSAPSPEMLRFLASCRGCAIEEMP